MNGDWITFVSAAVLLISALSLTAMVIWRQRPRRRSAAEAAPRPAVQRPAPVPEQLSRRLADLEQQLKLLGERQDQLDLRRASPQPFRMAIKLARRGTPSEEIAATCGISRGEAELVALLHRDRP